MKITRCLQHAFNLVLNSQLRSWLTIVGIVIGVAAVIAIISLGTGMRQEIDQRMSGLGGDILTLTAGFSRGSNIFGGRGPGSGGGSEGFGGNSAGATEKAIVLDRADLQALKGIPDLAIIDTRIRGNVDVSYLGKSGSISLTGVDQKVWSKIITDKVKDGRLLDSADQNVVVIGSRLAESYFDRPLGINKVLTIEGSAFRVVGILDDSSNNVYMPIQMAYQVLDGKENGVYDSIVIKIKNEEDLDAVIEKIEKKLMMTRHVTDKTKDFSVSSSKKMMETRSEMMSSMNIFLIAIAAVSLIVGAIGIANTMFTSVLEKTKEIGVMKAIGAKNGDIMKIFLMNAALIGLVGGILGVVAGIMLSGMLPSLMGGQVGMFRGGTVVSLDSILLALGVSLGVGIIAGAVPAYKASKLKPVDALRYE